MILNIINSIVSLPFFFPTKLKALIVQISSKDKTYFIKRKKKKLRFS